MLGSVLAASSDSRRNRGSELRGESIQDGRGIVGARSRISDIARLAASGYDDDASLADAGTVSAARRIAALIAVGASAAVSRANTGRLGRVANDGM
jgi:hypothetical protein